MVNCPHAASGCGYPQGECSGACLADKPKHQPAAPQYLTIVYRITDPGQPRALLERSEWSAASHTHAIHERDRLHAELNDVQDQRREAFRAIERLNDEIGRLTEQRDQLRAALKDVRGDLFMQIESKHGAKAASEYPSIVHAKEAIAKTEGGAT